MTTRLAHMLRSSDPSSSEEVKAVTTLWGGGQKLVSTSPP